MTSEKKNNQTEFSLFRRFCGHLKTVHIHRKNVRVRCFRLGLYRQGIFHDLSKYSPTEFLPSIRFYTGKRSPNAIDRELNGYSRAWLHHKGRNRHHFEYWIDLSGPPYCGVFPCKMPLRYTAEMVCDRIAACIAYHGENYQNGDAWEYYARNRKYTVMHPDTRAVLEEALLQLKENGEDACFQFLNRCLRQTKGLDYTAGSLGISPAEKVPGDRVLSSEK